MNSRIITGHEESHPKKSLCMLVNGLKYLGRVTYANKAGRKIHKRYQRDNSHRRAILNSGLIKFQHLIRCSIGSVLALEADCI